MLNVIDQTTASATTNIAAAVNTGRQRTAIHNKRENTNATGKSVAHGLCGREMKKLLSAARVVSAIVPSRSSRRGGGSRTASLNPISSGATVTVPSKPATNQICNRSGEIGLGSTKVTAIAAPAAPTPAAIALATRNPRTCGTSPSLNTPANQRWTSQAGTRTAQAFKTAKRMTTQGSLPIRRLDVTEAPATATVTGKRAAGPSAISTPVAMPAAGQKTATPTWARRNRPSRAARK